MEKISTNIKIQNVDTSHREVIVRVGTGPDITLQPGQDTTVAVSSGNDVSVIEGGVNADADAAHNASEAEKAAEEKTAAENAAPDQNRVRLNNGPWVVADSDEGRELLEQTKKALADAAEKGEVATISINDGPDLRIGSAEADEAIAALRGETKAAA